MFVLGIEPRPYVYEAASQFTRYMHQIHEKLGIVTFSTFKNVINMNWWIANKIKIILCLVPNQSI